MSWALQGLRYWSLWQAPGSWITTVLSRGTQESHYEIVRGILMRDSRQRPDRRDEAGSLDGFRSDGSNLGKAKSPTQITLLSLPHSPQRFWEVPRWPLASHEVTSVHGAFTVSSLTERRFIDRVVLCSEFSCTQRWQFALFLSRFHLLLMKHIARYKSIVTEN